MNVYNKHFLSLIEPFEGQTIVLADLGFRDQDEIFEGGLELTTTLRKNMKGQLMRLSDQLQLRKRFIIETMLRPSPTNARTSPKSSTLVIVVLSTLQ